MKKPAQLTEELVLRLKVICSELPGIRFCDGPGPEAGVRAPVYLGIQRDQEVIEQVPADRRSVTFQPEFRARRQADGSVNFLGPFAQGTRGDRFFYLSWGVKQPDGRFEMFRRLKVRLGHLTWEQVARAAAEKQPITVELRLTDARGGPLCATPPPTHIQWRL